MKKVLIPAAAAAASLFCGFVLAAGCVISNGVDFVHDIGQYEKATRSEQQTLKLAEGGKLEIALSSGHIVVRADSPGTPELAAVVTAYGEDAEAARKALDETRLVVEEIPGGARIRLTGQATEQRGPGVHSVSHPRADLELRLPRDVQLAFELGSGDIRTHGPIGPSRLKSSYGDVLVEVARGDLSLDSSSGRIELGALSAAQTLHARSGYGDVSVRSIEAEDVRLSSSSGDVRLEDAASKRVELESSYGAIVLRRVGGEVSARTSSGDVKAEDLKGPSASLASGYGDVELRSFHGELRASTSSGGISVAGIEGSCELQSGYGDVRVEGVLERVEGRSSSGSVRVRALAGSVLEGDWKLESGYGDVSLTLPRELGFELSARTGYGTLDVQFPVTVAAGGFKDKRSLQGQVGAGGRRVELKTSSGDVHLVPQD